VRVRALALQPLTVAYLGPSGTFSEQAALKHFRSPDVVLHPCLSIPDVFRQVEERQTGYGVVPVENSLDGSIRVTLDLFLSTELMVYGEVDLRVCHNLIVRTGTKHDQIDSVLSHPQALAQCRRYLEREHPNAKLREVSSTARAVDLLKTTDNAAAIGTETAAKNARMEVLATHIEDDVNNYTRFFVISTNDAPPSGRDKTSLIFSVKDVPGALFRILESFAVREINLTKIESRPLRRTPWNYVFYLDFEGHRTDRVSREALKEIQERCYFVKILGSYPRAGL
jgi:chorismate mutase/prephenate dehydratase